MEPVRRLIFLLVLCAVLLAPATAAAVDRTVSVEATVEREVPNDAAEVRFTVSKERPGRAAALRIVTIRLRAVIAAAQATPGVGPGDVTTGSVSVRRVERGKRPVYRASESVTVVTHRPEAAGDLVAAAVGATLGPAITITESGNVVPVSGPKAMEPASAEAPSPPVEPGSSKVRATVAATFALL
jgi:uncharacterized protein YggE